MPPKAILYAGDLVRVLASGLALFVAWWINHYILPLNDKMDAQDKAVAILKERDKNASRDRERLENEINRLRALHISGK